MTLNVLDGVVAASASSDEFPILGMRAIHIITLIYCGCPDLMGTVVVT